jgi:L-asparaginase II
MSVTASNNPVLVEVMRGAIVESRHAGAVAVADAAGRLLLALGDVERPIFPRSAVKALQAILLVERRCRCVRARRCRFAVTALAAAIASVSRATCSGAG